MPLKKQTIIISFISIVFLILAIHWLINHGIESTDDASVEAHTIPISPKVSGYITNLRISDNQHVKKGDILVEIDPRDYQLRLDAAKADVIAAEISAKNTQVDAKRQLTIGKAAGTQKDIDNATAAKAIAEARFENAKAQLAIAEKNLADTKIIAPQDGIITMRTAEQGAYVIPGQQLCILITNERWIIANFKEIQITHMQRGQKVEIYVDAYPKLKLEGQVDSIQSGTGARFSAFPAENATGNFVKIVQRIPVKITITTPLPENIVLGPGLSVTPTLYTTKSITP